MRGAARRRQREPRACSTSAPPPRPPPPSDIAGYASAGGRLTAREVEHVPDLVITRILNNVVYFVGRAIAGEDTIEPIRGRAAIYAKRCRFLTEHKPAIIEALRKSGVVEE